MNCSIIIPVRPPEEGKSRLADALAAHDRAALVETMFRHVLRVAVATVGPAQVHVVSRSPVLLAQATAQGCNAVRETAAGLNPALEQAARSVPKDRPLLALSADLPLLDRDDLFEMIAELAEAEAVLATDRAGVGTNALLLARPQLLPYAFGEHSRRVHERAAAVLGLRFCLFRRSGLAADLDLPEDLALLSAA